MVFFQKWPFFDVFEIPLCWQRKKSQKMTQKWASIFFPVPRFFDFSSAEISSKNPGTGDFLQNPFFARLHSYECSFLIFFDFSLFFQCQDFSKKSPVPKNLGTGKSEKPVFCPSPKRGIFHFSSSTKIVSSTRKSRHWKKWKTRFCPSPKNLLPEFKNLGTGLPKKKFQNAFFARLLQCGKICHSITIGSLNKKKSD